MAAAKKTIGRVKEIILEYIPLDKAVELAEKLTLVPGSTSYHDTVKAPHDELFTTKTTADKIRAASGYDASRPNLTCEECGARNAPENPVTIGVDPLASEIHHDDTERVMCKNCRDESA